MLMLTVIREYFNPFLVIGKHNQLVPDTFVWVSAFQVKLLCVNTVGADPEN